MTAVHTEATENTEREYRDPVVNGFYGTAIRALEEAPDGASAAAQITGEFHRHHTSHVTAHHALTNDVRRLSAEDGIKAHMLTYASRTASRLLEENLRQQGRIHAHQDVESKLHDLAGQLDAAHPAIAEQVREILEAIVPTLPQVSGPIPIASCTDTRWQVGWFRRTDRPDDAPLQPLPFVGWVLIAHAGEAPAQAVQSAFLYAGQWFSRDELDVRGMRLMRMD